MLGFMLTTMFLSMWISNTATIAMMVPIVDAITEAISKCQDNNNGNIEENKKPSSHNEVSRNYLQPSSHNEVSRNYLLLACAYASNIGGTGVITGSPPNLVVLSVLNKDYGEGKAPLSYATWMAFCIPLMILNVLLG